MGVSHPAQGRKVGQKGQQRLILSRSNLAARFRKVRKVAAALIFLWGALTGRKLARSAEIASKRPILSRSHLTARFRKVRKVATALIFL